MPYRHEAFMYTSEEELFDVNRQWLKDGLDAGDVVALGFGAETNARIAGSVGPHPCLRLLPEGGVYGKAVDALAFYHDLVTETAAEQRAVRALAEVSFSTDARGREEWRRYESICNHVLAPLPLWSVCAYHTPALPEALVETARATHPWLRTVDGPQPNRDYVPPGRLLDESDRGLPTPTGPTATVNLTHTGDLAELRQWLRRHLDAAEVTEGADTEMIDTDTVDAVVLAANEVVANGLQHGRPPVEVTLWQTRQHIVCDVTDQGPGLRDPLVGYTPPDPLRPAEEGAGLWMTRRLCDDVTVGQTPAGSTIRLTVRRSP